MLKLYGFDVSNYYNMVKMAMAIKDIEYEAVHTYPNQSPEYLAICPTGKVPCLQTPEGVIAETNAILEYLDESYAQSPLIWGNAFEKAQIRELMKMVELYIELPARRCHAEAFWGVQGEELTKKEVKLALKNGMQFIARTASFSPYLMGDKISAADIMFMYSVNLASAVAKKLFDIDLLSLAPGAQELMQTLNSMPEAQVIAADLQEATPAFQAYLQAAFAKK
ncbi:glutathione S-transferase family protein [Glaciecola sp. 2405UD65-10]|uniref:glutathione S-transferase family protein n=1 Tax=Glaciecola sp. 2405UD65-10 TaxID=3397244 RepID=UPI003B5CAA63